MNAMDLASTDFRPCPFCAHAEPIVVTVADELPANVITRLVVFQGVH